MLSFPRNRLGWKKELKAFSSSCMTVYCRRHINTNTRAKWSHGVGGISFPWSSCWGSCVPNAKNNTKPLSSALQLHIVFSTLGFVFLCSEAGFPFCISRLRHLHHLLSSHATTRYFLFPAFPSFSFSFLCLWSMQLFTSLISLSLCLSLLFYALLETPHRVLAIHILNFHSYPVKVIFVQRDWFPKGEFHVRIDPVTIFCKSWFDATKIPLVFFFALCLAWPQTVVQGGWLLFCELCSQFSSTFI